MNDIRSLVVFSSLKVHEIRVEATRVRATYTLTRKNGELAHNELIYSYSSPFFDPGNPEDINLASMMLAQVSLNYGLFCERQALPFRNDGEYLQGDPGYEILWQE